MRKMFLLFVMTVISSANADFPQFTLSCPDDKPSCVIFSIAHELGLLDGRKGEMGEIEKKYKVDIVWNRDTISLTQPRLNKHHKIEADFICITNIEILRLVKDNSVIQDQYVAILPISHLPNYEQYAKGSETVETYATSDSALQEWASNLEIDMIVTNALTKENAESAARAICETFYRVNSVGNSPLYYDTPRKGIDFFNGKDLKETMAKIVSFCHKASLKHLEVKCQSPSLAIPNNVSISYPSTTTMFDSSDLRFDTSYMKAVESTLNGSIVFFCPACSGTRKILKNVPCPDPLCEKGQQRCYSCNGTGKTPCPNCGGSGTVTVESIVGDGVIRTRNYSQVACSACGGKGQFTCTRCAGNTIHSVCSKCKGKGTVSRIVPCTTCKRSDYPPTPNKSETNADN